MASDAADKYSFDPPQFRDLVDMLGKCGEIVIKGITQCVTRGVKPNGSQQKQNAASTILAKGHSHPVTEFRGRFEKRATYSNAPIDAETVMIGIRSGEDSEIGAALHGKGYEFFGVTDDAARRCDQLMDLYVQERITDAFQGKT